MSKELITAIICAAIAVVILVCFLVALFRGEVKKFIVEKMNEAEEMYKDLPKPEKSQKKLAYVLAAVKDKYKIAELVLNIKKFIEYIVSVTKINK